ncbi:hypothetical protein NDA16_004409 [Ustilago loliicola]|nr:hypothetical protein NDA16_004409 [Ustilago loliicola]
MADIATTSSITNSTSSASMVPDSEWKHPVYGPTDKYTPGIAPIKAEYILPKPASIPIPNPVDDDAAERTTNPATSTTPPSSTTGGREAEGEPVKKLKGAARKRVRREEAAAQRAQKKSKAGSNGGEPGGKKGGQNKARQFNSLKDGKGHCHGFLSRGEDGCKFSKTGGCRFSHDLVGYLKGKDRDLFLPPVPHKELEAMSAEQKQQWLGERYSLSLLPASTPAQDAEGEGEGEGGMETFVRANSSSVAPPAAKVERSSDPAHASLDMTTSCPIFAIKGFCTMGWKCRFLGSHVKIIGPSSAVDKENPTGFAGSGLELVRDEEKVKAWRERPRAFTLPSGGEDVDQEELNFGTSAGMKSMRIRKYPLPKTKAVLKYLERESKELAKADPQGSTAGKGPIPQQVVEEAVAAHNNPAPAPAPAAEGSEDIEEMENSIRNSSSSLSTRVAEAATSCTSIDIAHIRPSEKRRLNWKGELYLAPLTTTGNLPFRRICTSFGSDIHCGEMGLAESFLHGNASEWSLVRRHSSERIFGTQLCGGKPDLLVPVAEALKAEIGDGLDFVDINCGCPIDLVYNKGAGSALLDHPSKLSKIVRGMNAALGDTPLTVKLRTGTGAKQTTHKIFGKAQTEWGASAATLHGRSRKQRYKNDADWGYIATCARTLRDSVREWNEESRHADEPEMVPIPVYGNGDVYSWQDYYERLERTSVDGEMIARGALIKPWLFTEIKERRDWDISSRERLDMSIGVPASKDERPIAVV